MQRLHLPRLGLLIAAALLPACTPQRASDNVATTRPFAAKPLLRLASYEPGSKVDVVMQSEAEPADGRRGRSPNDQVPNGTPLGRPVAPGGGWRPVQWS